MDSGLESYYRPKGTTLGVLAGTYEAMSENGSAGAFLDGTCDVSHF